MSWDVASRNFAPKCQEAADCRFLQLKRQVASGGSESLELQKGGPRWEPRRHPGGPSLEARADFCRRPKEPKKPSSVSAGVCSVQDRGPYRLFWCRVGGSCRVFTGFATAADTGDCTPYSLRSIGRDTGKRQCPEGGRSVAFVP